MAKVISDKQKTVNKNRILKVLAEQGFMVGDREMEIIESQVALGKRYFFMVAQRMEGGVLVERFVKIPMRRTKKLLEPFARQILFAQYLKEHTTLGTRGVIEYNCDTKKGIPFAVMETFPTGHSKIGFIEGTNKVDLLGEVEAKSIVQSLEKFHSIPYNDLPAGLRKIIKTKNRGTGFDYIRESVANALDRKVLPLDAAGGRKQALHKVLARRLGMSDFKKMVESLLDTLESVADEDGNKTTCLVHGDMAPNNLYVFDGGEVEFLDFEWVSVFKNKLVAMVYDYGNLRVRSWNNPVFQDCLDSALLDMYRSQGEERLGRAVLCLSILRSNIRFSGYFENYPWDKQRTYEEKMRREMTEEDIQKIWRYGF